MPRARSAALAASVTRRERDAGVTSAARLSPSPAAHDPRRAAAPPAAPAPATPPRAGVERAERVALVQPHPRRLRPSRPTCRDACGRRPRRARTRPGVAQQIQSPAQLDVLVVGERALVPAARRRKNTARSISIAQPQANSSGFSSSARLSAGRVVVELKPLALKVHRAADEIVLPAGPVEDAARHGGRTPATRGCHQLEQPVGTHTRVVVEKDEVIAGRRGGARLLPAANPMFVPFRMTCARRDRRAASRRSDRRPIRCRRR